MFIRLEKLALVECDLCHERYKRAPIESMPEARHMTYAPLASSAFTPKAGTGDSSSAPIRLRSTS